MRAEDQVQVEKKGQKSVTFGTIGLGRGAWNGTRAGYKVHVVKTTAPSKRTTNRCTSTELDL